MLGFDAGIPAALWLWLASLAGAAIFLALGLVLGRAGRAQLAAKHRSLEDTFAASEAERQQQRATELGARVALREENQALQAVLAESQAALAAREAKLAELERERANLLEQRAALQRQLDADENAEKSLRHDLALARELARTLESKTQRLEEAHAAARAESDALASQAARCQVLEREVAALRSRALITDLAAPALLAPAGAHALDEIPTRLLGIQPVRAAVIGDELGLVVSSQGSHGDELAALGALFNRACNEARRILPLGRVVRVTVEDERRIHLTMRPLGSEGDAAGPADQLTLVTLANGFEPDPTDVTRIVSRASAQGPRTTFTT